MIRFLDDGRFSMTNTAAERQLHVIAIERNNWILAGFDERVLLTSSIV
ncbi:MAG: transposase [Xanthobacteraceae bacterium]